MPDYKIEWLLEATKDVVRLREFIKKENPRAAKNAGLRILDAVNMLTKGPEAGMPSPDDDCEAFRNLYAPFGKSGYTSLSCQTTDYHYRSRMAQSRRTFFSL